MFLFVVPALMAFPASVFAGKIKGKVNVKGLRTPADIVVYLTKAPAADVDTLVVDDPKRVAYLTQTTLSLDETTGIIKRLRQRFPEIEGPPASRARRFTPATRSP